MNKKSRWWQLVSNPRRLLDVVLVLWVLRSTIWAITALKEKGLLQIYKIYKYKREGYN